jgi:hypothetical protein
MEACDASSLSSLFGSSLYLQLLKCSSNPRSNSYKFPVQLEGLEVVPYHVDHTLPTQSRQSPSKQMISGIQIPPRDIRRCLFPSLTVQAGANKLDAFNTMASSLFLEVNVGIHDDNSPTVPEMALHLRLNLAAFYHGCACFPFISDTMVEWSILVVEEYEYLVKRKMSLKGVCWSSMFCHPSSRTGCNGKITLRYLLEG